MNIVGIVFLLFIGLITLPFLFFVTKLVLKAKKSSWSGVVLEKGHNAREDFDNPHKIEHFYFLKVKMDNGDTRNVGLSEQMWGNFEVGDKIKKDSGKLYPEKI